MAEEEEENIFSFRDKTPAPDPTHEYSDTVRDAHTPIIIDNGNKFVQSERSVSEIISESYSECFFTFLVRSEHTHLFLSGGYKCRVGWASDEEPRVVFKNVIAKQRGKKVRTISILSCVFKNSNLGHGRLMESQIMEL